MENIASRLSNAQFGDDDGNNKSDSGELLQFIPNHSDNARKQHPFIHREPALSNENCEPPTFRPSWELMYRELKSFAGTLGHVRIPTDKKLESLRDWLNRQILSKNLLTEKQFQQLDKLGIDWNTPLSRDHAWNLMYWRLKDFHRVFGHSRVPFTWAADKQLATWVSVQKRTCSQNKIREDRLRLLNELDFTWAAGDKYNRQWESFFNELVSHHEEYGHCNVPPKYDKFVSWIERQRLLKKRKTLSSEREKRLDEINFIWSFDSIKEQNWNEKYQLLCEYNKVHGHSFVSTNYKKNRSLGVWVALQRLQEAQNRLSEDKKNRLCSLNFVWSKDTHQRLKSEYDADWEATLEKLKIYKQVYGTLQVSLKIDLRLQRWTVWQRRMFYQGRMSAERIDKLNEICFPWSIQEGYWMKMYDALARFKSEFGHTRVPSGWKANQQLAAWVYRVKFNRDRLSAQKTDLLNAIRFDWTLRRKIRVEWELMYQRLAAFKQTHSHTRVPATWCEDRKLGRWVSRIRNERKKISPERMILLEAIGFEWRKGTASKRGEIWQPSGAF